MRRGVRRLGQLVRCRQTMRVLQSYLDGQVDEVTAARVARHLEACRRCGLEADVYDEIKTSLRQRAAGVPQPALDRLREFGEQLHADRPAGGAG